MKVVLVCLALFVAAVTSEYCNTTMPCTANSPTQCAGGQVAVCVSSECTCGTNTGNACQNNGDCHHGDHCPHGQHQECSNNACHCIHGGR